jgi:hypothetical protein
VVVPVVFAGKIVDRLVDIGQTDQVVKADIEIKVLL